MKLNKEQSKKYIEIVRGGNMDIMFDFAYALGWKNAIRFTKNENILPKVLPKKIYEL